MNLPDYDNDGNLHDPGDADLYPDRCEDCGVSLARHGGECGYEVGDHASGYFEPPQWVTP